jgi:cellulose biosynthesis protein BcsQ
MLLANLGWLLAAAGHSVVMIDWDFEAPGLHRYFRPFLDDPDLSETHGLLDFLQEFVDGARLRLLESQRSNSALDAHWFEEFATLSRFSIPINHDFPNEGSLELIGAGRQGPGYSQTVNSFHWDDFYTKAGGGLFLEKVKELLRREYDYILIDSRTGLSDTAGICTIQMPDDLVVCLTLNRQSIEGAEAVARSASQARRKPSGAPGLRVWPVAMRVELAEKERLDRWRIHCRERLTPLAWQLTKAQRAEYWRDMEIFYLAYYAYEEILAPIADTPGSRNTLLDNVLAVGRRILEKNTLGETGIHGRTREIRLIESLRMSDRVDDSLSQRQINEVVVLSEAVSTSPEQFEAAERLSERLTESFQEFMRFHHGTPETLFEESEEGSSVRKPLPRTLITSCSSLVLILPARPSTQLNDCIQRLIDTELKKIIVCHPRPSLMELKEPHNSAADKLKRQASSDWVFLPGFVSTSGSSIREPDLAPLKRLLKQYVQEKHAVEQSLDDPQQGRWGGSATFQEYRLDANIEQPSSSEQWFQVTLILTGSPNARPLEGPVEFHLHPGCVSSPQTVQPASPHEATLTFHTHRAFTVGVSCLGGAIRLELDLRDVPEAPPAFVES